MDAAVDRRTVVATITIRTGRSIPIGPEIKIRGSAAHVYEKYLQLARDANSAGDRVMAENYLQHAEHYYRMMAAAQAQQQQYQAQQGQQNGAQPTTQMAMSAARTATAKATTTINGNGGSGPSFSLAEGGEEGDDEGEEAGAE